MLNHQNVSILRCRGWWVSSTKWFEVLLVHLLDVGIKKLNREDIHKILESGKRTEKVVSAPAHGLSWKKFFIKRPKCIRRKMVDSRI